MATDVVVQATGMSNILNASTTFSHGTTSATATIECEGLTVDIGDSINLDINYATVFQGYIKQIVQDANKDSFTITASDKLIRAVDFFIVPSSPTETFTRSNITGEQLITDLLALANLVQVDADATSFTFATTSPLEVKLVSVYDMCKTICDLLAWHIWVPLDGSVHFKNRKPYVMTADSEENNQPGYAADTIYLPTLTDDIIISASYSEDNTNLRNKIVVQGSGDIYAVASAVSPYLPNISGSPFYSTVFFSDYQLITTQEDAQRAADYNLILLNRLTKRLNVDIVGDTSIACWECHHVNSENLGIDSDWYVYSLTHNFSNNGFITSLELRQ